MANFIKDLNHQHKIILLAGGLSLPSDHETTRLIKWFISSAAGKIYKPRAKTLRELEAPWLTSFCNLLFYIFHCFFFLYFLYANFNLLCVDNHSI